MPISVLLPVLFVLLSALLLPVAQADDDDESRPLAGRAPAAAGLTLAVGAAERAGIETRKLVAVSLLPEFTVYGSVLSLEPLLQLRQQFLAVRAQQDSARAKFSEAHANLARTENLYHQDVVSTRRMQEQQAQWQADKASLEVSGYQQQTILAASRLEWGAVLTDWFVSDPGSQAGQFLQQGAQLLQITLPAGVRLEPGVRQIAIDEHGRRQSAVAATLISQAPKVDPLTLGERYFFRAQDRRLPLGAHVTAWVAAGDRAVGGVLLPDSALVRHLGQTFVFVKTAGNGFVRRPVPECSRQPGGCFVAGYLQPGEEVVVTGAQTLLSQQLKASIPDEDRD